MPVEREGGYMDTEVTAGPDSILTISWRQTSRQRRGQWRRELPGAERQVREHS